jgi:hypothetical protein
LPQRYGAEPYKTEGDRHKFGIRGFGDQNLYTSRPLPPYLDKALVLRKKDNSADQGDRQAPNGSKPHILGHKAIALALILPLNKTLYIFVSMLKKSRSFPGIINLGF